MIRKILIVLIFLILSVGQAQQDDVKIELRDYHSSNITEIETSKLYPYFFTADESGKVLAYNSETKRVVKTIRSASGIPIKSMRLAYDDKVLLLNQKYAFSDGKTDSLIGVRIFDQKVVLQNAANIEFIGNQKDAIITKDTNPNGSLNIVDVYNRKFEKIKRYYSSSKVTLAAYESESQQMAMVEGQIGQQLRIAIQLKDDYKNLENVEIPKSIEILQLFFDEGQLYAITRIKEAKQIEFFNLSKSKNFDSSVYALESNIGEASFKINISNNSDKLQIAITSVVGLTTNPIIIEKQKSKFKHSFIQTEYGAINSVYLGDTDEYLFFESYQVNFGSSVRFSVFDNSTNKIVKTIPEVAKPFYYGAFLPNDNWMIVGNEIGEISIGIAKRDHHLKYYEAGTFNNRFNKLSYNDYFEVNYGIEDFSQGDFNYGKHNGLHPFYGLKKLESTNSKNGFYVYDIVNDQVELISEKDPGKKTIIDYNANTNLLLLSTSEYYNGGHTKPQEFITLNGDDIVPISGVYKFGKFSTTGDYLLLISDKNEVTIRDVYTQNIIHSQTLVDGKYKIYAVEGDDFLISNSYWALKQGGCNSMSIGLILDANKKVVVQNTDCINILDIATANETTVLSVEYLGLIVGEILYKFQNSEFPTRVSLNSDGTKLMASFNNGKIRIYKTEGLELLAEMVHPDGNSHVFVDNKNNYFSNIDPEVYIAASINSKGTPLKGLETDYYKPKEVLKAFGTPNQDYVTTLKKALSLKQENQYANTDVEIELPKVKSNKKGDLYLLSIGVSDYEQSDFNLTFADKDALDMAKIYGNLTKKEINKYKTKFNGDIYGLKDKDENLVGELKKYQGKYNSAGYLYALNLKGTLWLEDKHNDFFLWNFEDETVVPIQMPSDFELGVLTFEPVVFADPDAKGFYIKTSNDDYLHYSLATNKFEIVQMSKVLTERQVSSNDLVLLLNNQWAHFASKYDGLSNEIKITKGNINSEDVEYVTFNPDIYNSVLENGEKVVDTSYLNTITLKAFSVNGMHLLYTTPVGDLFYKDLRIKDDLPQKFKIRKIEYSEKLSIADDGLSFSVIQTISNDFKYKIENYSIDGDLTNTHILKDDVIALSYYNNNPLWITVSEPLVEEEFLSSDDVLESSQPVSFNTAYVKYLVNANATSQSITSEILEFFKKAKPEDQVMLFLAGHGVLDKDLTYYFAPYNMDFNNVEAQGVSFNTIIDNINQSKAVNKLLLMDSCHSGNTLDIESGTYTPVKISNSTNKRGANARNTNTKSKFKVSEIVSGLFEDFLSKSGVTVISASSGEDVAYENKKLGNGAFTSAYIKYLKDKLKSGGFVITEDEVKKSIVFTDDAISEILKQVMILTSSKQTPDLREFNKEASLKMW
jgi:hypothetical protein